MEGSRRRVVVKLQFGWLSKQAHPRVSDAYNSINSGTRGDQVILEDCVFL